jgi:hypothetical protein
MLNTNIIPSFLHMQLRPVKFCPLMNLLSRTKKYRLRPPSYLITTLRICQILANTLLYQVQQDRYNDEAERSLIYLMAAKSQEKFMAFPHWR